ncbi:hypothetical protein SAMN05428978_100618 [Nitrosomonas sp. Nm34]|nr:hypothetical protein SAMN05428978_100618 [Nitrosomonas sp. Nm34]
MSNGARLNNALQYPTISIAGYYNTSATTIVIPFPIKIGFVVFTLSYNLYYLQFVFASVLIWKWITCHYQGIFNIES